MKFHTAVLKHACVLGALAGWAGPLAAGAPDAGQTLQQFRPSPPPPAPAAGLTGQPPAPQEAKPAPPPSEFEERVQLREVVFQGHTRFDAATLEHLVADALGRSLSFRELDELTDRITRFYRSAGYPFAQARLPAQEIVEGRLRIEVVEGRLGAIQALDISGVPVPEARAFLESLQPGAVIEGRALERVLQLIDEQPGYRSSAVMRPGSSPGLGDLLLVLEKTPSPTLELGLDNHGNRYTGRQRLRLDFVADSPFRFGDRLALTGLTSRPQQSGNITFGDLSYQWPLDNDGLRAQFRYASSGYRLGQEFAALDQSGSAKAIEIGLSHALLRARDHQTTLTWRLIRKTLGDHTAATGEDSATRSWSLPANVRAEFRDAFGGGGLTLLDMTWTWGRVRNRGSAAQAPSSPTAFTKLEATVARTQRLTGPFSAHVQLTTQTSRRDLDSSEGFDISGPQAVRAYPSGDAYGDEGWFTRAELRWSPVDRWTAFLFHDQGTSNSRHDPTTDHPRRRIAGHGIGLRFGGDSQSLEAVLAWPTRRLATTDPQESVSGPRIWVRLHHRFD